MKVLTISILTLLASVGSIADERPTSMTVTEFQQTQVSQIAVFG